MNGPKNQDFAFASNQALTASTSSDRLTLLLESTGEGIFGIDLDGRCTFMNRAAAQILGWRTESVLGRNMHWLMHHTHSDGRAYPEEQCPIFNAFRQGLPCRIDYEVLWRADGSWFWAEYSSYPIIENGHVDGAVVTFVDITERKRAEELLRKTNDQLESRVAERTQELSAALQRIRELANHAEAARESERTRIAREIHDELGSMLVALKMDVNWLGKRLQDAPALVSKCQGMGELIDTAVDNLGRIITDLRPSILDHQGLWAALEWQAQEFIEGAELAADLRVHVEVGVLPPDGLAGKGWSIAVFRIFQEMLSNVARHAKASKLQVRILVDQAALLLQVEDDGVGAAREALDDRRSYGVMGMRERAAHFGGRLSIVGMPGHGTCAKLVMPMPDREAPPRSAADVADPTTANGAMDATAATGAGPR